MFSEQQKTELEKKLDQAHVQPPKKFGPKGNYIEGWHAIAEANRIFGFDKWSYEVVRCDCVSQAERKIGRDKKDGWGVTYVARVRTGVENTTREDVGAGHGYDVDLGLAHESAIKEAVTDALKRCLRTYGNPFGLALYDKSGANVGPSEPTQKDQREAAEKHWISKREPGSRMSEKDSATLLKTLKLGFDKCDILDDLNSFANANKDEISVLTDKDYVALIWAQKATKEKLSGVQQ